MAKRFQPNRKKWPVKSDIPIKSHVTKQIGYIYSKRWLPNEGENKGYRIKCIWKGHEFSAKDWTEAYEYIGDFDQLIIEY